MPFPRTGAVLQSVLEQRVCAGSDASRPSPLFSHWFPPSSPIWTRWPNRPTRAWASARWSGCAITAQRGLCRQVESIYYSLTAPSKGGPTLRALPQVGYGAAARARAQRLQAQRLAAASYRPPRVAPLFHPALPGEGVWRATRPGLGTGAPLLITTLRNQPEYPRVAGLAWIDTKRTTLTLNPGRLEPSVSIPRGSMDVPRHAGASCSRPSTAASSSATRTAGSSSTATPTPRCKTVRPRSWATATGRVDVHRLAVRRAGARLDRVRASEPAADRGRRTPHPEPHQRRNGARRSATRSASGARASASTATAT